MSTDNLTETYFPAERGFILQFKPASGTGEPVFIGRIEHIVSGSVQHFFSAEELSAALHAMLVELTDNRHG